MTPGDSRLAARGRGVHVKTLEITMLTRAIVAALLLVVMLLPAGLLACGDKFLVVGRGVRFRDRPVNRETAAVLLYAPPGSGLNGTAQAASVEAALRKAGYRPTLATSEPALDSLLHRTRWDVVILDLADRPAFVGRLPATTTPDVLPVAYRLSKAELGKARQHYRRVLEAPAKQRAIVQAVDDVLAERARARAKSMARIGG